MSRRSWSLDDYRLSDRDPRIVALVAALVIAGLVLLGLNLTRIPLLHHVNHYSAYLENASGLEGGETVQIRGVRVGKVTGIDLVDDRVRVQFEVEHDVHVGNLTLARVKVLNPLGAQYLALEPRGEDDLEAAIPLSRTTVSRTLVNELGRITERVEDIDVEQLQASLETVNDSLSDTSAASMAKALTGLNDFAGNLAEDSEELSTLVTEGSDLAGLLSGRRDEIGDIVTQGAAVTKVLAERREALSTLVRSTNSLSERIATLLRDNQDELTPMLKNLQKISRSLARENEELGRSIPAMAQLTDSVARVTGTGRYADIVVPNGLVPDDVVQECSDSSNYPSPDRPEVGCRP